MRLVCFLTAATNAFCSFAFFVFVACTTSTFVTSSSSSDVLKPSERLALDATHPRARETFVADESRRYYTTHDDPTTFRLDRYHGYEEIVAFLRGLSVKHADFVELHSIGRSYEGRELLYVKIGDRRNSSFDHAQNNRSSSASPPPKTTPTRRKAMLIDAGMHAREWVAPAVALYTIFNLINNRSLYANVLHNVDVFVLPLLNPDGYEHSRLANNRLWRRTRSWNPSAKCMGVDANRNFPYYFNETESGTSYCSDFYVGPKALSEPETRALAQFLKDHRESLKAYLSLHSFGNLITYPYARHKATYPPDVDELQKIARQMSKVIEKNGGPSFGVASFADAYYESSGMSDSYAKTLGIKYTYVMEMTEGHGFEWPEHKLLAYCKQVSPGILFLASHVANM